MRINASGLDALIGKLDNLQENTSEIAHRGIYKAAGIVADEVKRGLESLPVNDDPGETITGVTSKEKESLVSSLGVARHREQDGVVTTSIGFSGLSQVKTKAYPKGVPNAGLMRAIESGTSVRKKNPVIRQAANRVRQKAKEAAKQEILNDIKKEI